VSNAGLLRSAGESAYKIVNLFGHASSVGTAYELLSNDGFYQRPAVSGATPLRVKAGGNAADDAAGAGARSVKLTGLNAALTEITETIVTAGASASSFTTASFFRLHRVEVEDTGTRPTSGTNSHAASIVIEDSGAAVWGTVEFGDLAHSVSQTSCYTIPLTLANGTTIKSAYLMSYLLTVDTGKTVDGVLCRASNILTTAAPFSPMLVEREHIGFSNEIQVVPASPMGPFPPGTDLIAMVRGASTPDVGAALEYALLKAAI